MHIVISPAKIIVIFLIIIIATSMLVEMEAIAETSQLMRCVWMYHFPEFDNATEIKYLMELSVNQVFLSLDVRKIDSTAGTFDRQYTQKLVDFIQRAKAPEIQIHAMTLEEPIFTYEVHHPDGLALIEHALQYCRTHPHEVFAGIHIDTEPHALEEWKEAGDDWTRRELLMAQYVQLLSKIRHALDKSDVDLEFSASIAWWYNERADSGDLPSGDAVLLATYLDCLAPMVYDGIGGTAEEIIKSASDETAEAKTLIGMGVHEFDTYIDLMNVIKQVNHHFAEYENYQGVSIFKYETLKEAYIASCKPGDTSGNSIVTPLDAAIVLQKVVGKITLPDENYPCFTPCTADVSGDGTVSAYDAGLIFQRSIGIVQRSFLISP